jgi:hypothetical protein
MLYRWSIRLIAVLLVLAPLVAIGPRPQMLHIPVWAAFVTAAVVGVAAAVVVSAGAC